MKTAKEILKVQFNANVKLIMTFCRQNKFEDAGSISSITKPIFIEMIKKNIINSDNRYKLCSLFNMSSNQVFDIENSAD